MLLIAEERQGKKGRAFRRLSLRIFLWMGVLSARVAKKRATTHAL
jgi:hypothetical protein